MAQDQRRLVSIGCRILGQHQSDFIWGHLSARHQDSAGLYIKPGGFGFDEIHEDTVQLLSQDGTVLDGPTRRHFEYHIHTEIMNHRPEVGAIVHSHPRAATAFASLGVPLRPLSHEGTLFWPDVPRFTETGDLIVTPELGASVATALGDSNALLLVNHGIVTVGPDVPCAVTTALLLDKACHLQLQAMSAGQLARWSDEDEALSKREHCYSENALHDMWRYLQRGL